MVGLVVVVTVVVGAIVLAVTVGEVEEGAKDGTSVGREEDTTTVGNTVGI